MKDGEWIARKSNRLRVTLHARCTALDAEEQGVTLVNVTPEGCCMTTGGLALQRGVAVLVRLENGEALTGQVRWCDDERAGIEFDSYLPQHRVDYLRREQTTFLGETDHSQLAVRRSVWSHSALGSRPETPQRRAIFLLTAESRFRSIFTPENRMGHASASRLRICATRISPAIGESAGSTTLDPNGRIRLVIGQTIVNRVPS